MTIQYKKKNTMKSLLHPV